MNAFFQEVEPVDTELHLGIGVILAIFSGITLVSAVFFGLGYSFGRTGTPTHVAGLVQASESPATPIPSAMQPLHRSAATMPENNAASQKPVASTQQLRPVHPLTRSSASTKALVVPVKAPAKIPASPSGSNSAYMVQVAAVANRNDAQVLASALQKHGLNAKVRSGTHDKFFHVLIGPFDTQQKAETMRHKVIASGYKAYLKPAS